MIISLLATAVFIESIVCYFQSKKIDELETSINKLKDNQEIIINYINQKN